MTREFALWCAYSNLLDVVAPLANGASDAAAHAVTACATTADQEFIRTVSDRLEAERERLVVAMRRFPPEPAEQPLQAPPQRAQRGRR